VRRTRIVELVAGRGLHQVAGGAVLDGGQHVFVFGAGRQDEDAGVRERLQDPLRGVDAGSLAELEVHEHDVRPDGGCDPNRRIGVARGRDDVVAPAGQVALDALTPDRMVVDDHHPDRHALSGLSIVISHSVPSPGAVCRSTRPPRSRTRPRIDWAMPSRPSLSAWPSRSGVMPAPSSRTQTATASPRSSTTTYARASGPAC
jgi:hypothetical protein